MDQRKIDMEKTIDVAKKQREKKNKKEGFASLFDSQTDVFQGRGRMEAEMRSDARPNV